ncbi:hypothetical protein Agub_g10428, partial [Astrephomene gubernaculifera]
TNVTNVYKMADGRLAVLLAHLAPSQHPSSSQPGRQPLPGLGEVPWTIACSGPLVIIGGACLDIQAQPSSVDVHRGTSVPGKVRQVPGGVGRNLAEALSGLLPPHRAAPLFVSLVGDDTAGAALTASLRKLRLDLTHLVTHPGATTPCVSAVLDRTGEVAACVADVGAVEQLLTPGRLAACRQQIQQACMVLAEANLSSEALLYVSRTAALARVPVFLEPVSVPKATRLAPSLPYATFVSPNAAELISLADEVRRSAGLPLLPRPSLPGDPPSLPAFSGSGGGSADHGGSGGDGSGGSNGSGSGAEPAHCHAEAAAAAAAGGGGVMLVGVVPEPVVELLRQLAGFAEAVLSQGTSCVVLTLGSLGSALVNLCDANTAAAAAPRPPLEPIDACSTPHTTATVTASLAIASSSSSCNCPNTHYHHPGSNPGTTACCTCNPSCTSAGVGEQRLPPGMQPTAAPVVPVPVPVHPATSCCVATSCNPHLACQPAPAGADAPCAPLQHANASRLPEGHHRPECTAGATANQDLGHAAAPAAAKDEGDDWVECSSPACYAHCFVEPPPPSKPVQAAQQQQQQHLQPVPVPQVQQQPVQQQQQQQQQLQPMQMRVSPPPAPPLAASPPPHPRHQLVEVTHLRALPAEVASVNGAGDTLVAGMVAALLQQHPPAHALAYGMAAAKRAVESHRNVPELLDFAALRTDADAVLGTMQRHFFPTVL